MIHDTHYRCCVNRIMWSVTRTGDRDGQNSLFKAANEDGGQKKAHLDKVGLSCLT